MVNIACFAACVLVCAIFIFRCDSAVLQRGQVRNSLFAESVSMISGHTFSISPVSDQMLVVATFRNCEFPAITLYSSGKQAVEEADREFLKRLGVSAD